MSMYRRKNNKKPPVMINVAPLVDVMLVLLIIFMITAPMMNVGVEVNLPKTKAASTSEEKTAPVVVSIDKNSKIFIEEAEITLEDLVAKLPNIMSTGKSDVIYVRADESLSYGDVMKIMGVISSSGAAKVALISDMDTSNKKIPDIGKKTSDMGSAVKSKKTSKGSPKKR